MINKIILSRIIYLVIKKHRSVQSLRHFCADGFFSNSIIPSPVDFPLSSTITTARSTPPKYCSNASLSNSFDAFGERFLTFIVAP